MTAHALLLRQALDALELEATSPALETTQAAIDALREALAAPQAEPRRHRGRRQMIIPLPPLPEPTWRPDEQINETGYIDENAYTADQLRARDLEVARVVLEAVADWIKTQRMVTPANGYEFASSIRTLEFKHE